MAAIPRYRPRRGLALLSAGFRPFFLLAALWSCLAIPIWIAFFAGLGQVPTAFAPVVWHVHEMTFGFGAAAVAKLRRAVCHGGSLSETAPSFFE